jgi:Tol biopolymer transport system component
MAPDGSDVHILASESRIVRGLVWSPDGQKIVYIADPGGLMSVAANEGSIPIALLSRPYSMEYTEAVDLSWQPVFPR